MMRHLRKCKLQHPPGDEIYRRHYPGGRSVSMFEVCSERLPMSQDSCCAFDTCCRYAGGCSVFMCEILRLPFSSRLESPARCCLIPSVIALPLLPLWALDA